jgi:hypothetical protein
MADAPARDFFDKAREVVSAAVFIAGALAIIGSLLDWVTFPIDEHALPGVLSSPPLSGVDVGDGKWVLGAGVVIVVAAFLLVVRQSAGPAWVSLIVSMVVGAIGVSDFRGVAEVSAEVDIVGVPHVGVGLTMVVGAAILGLLASIAGIAASPRRGR